MFGSLLVSSQGLLGLLSWETLCIFSQAGSFLAQKLEFCLFFNAHGNAAKQTFWYHLGADMGYLFYLYVYLGAGQ